MLERELASLQVAAVAVVAAVHATTATRWATSRASALMQTPEERKKMSIAL